MEKLDNKKELLEKALIERDISTLKSLIKDQSINFDFFLKICQTHNNEYIRLIINQSNELLQVGVLTRQQIFNFLKNGIIYIIQELPIEFYARLNYILLNYSFDNFIIIRSIINLPPSKKRTSLIKVIRNSSQDYLNSDSIIDEYFIEKHSQNHTDTIAIQSFCLSSIHYFMNLNPAIMNAKKQINDNNSTDLKEEQYNYNVLLPKVFKMTPNLSHLQQNLTSIFLSNAIYNNLNNNNQHLFIKLIKEYNVLTKDLLAVIFKLQNLTLFDEVYSYFKLDYVDLNFSLLELFYENKFFKPNHSQSMSVFKLFISKILQAKNTKEYLSDISGIIYILGYSNELLFHILTEKGDLFTQFSDKNKILELYNAASEPRNQAIFNYFIENKVLFQYIDLNYFSKNITFYNSSQRPILYRAVTLFNF